MSRNNQITLAEHDRLRLARLAQDLLRREGEPSEKGEALVDLIDTAEVVASNALPPDVVTMNATVLYDDGVSGPLETLTLVYPEDANAALRLVSVISPLGLALIGRREGDLADFTTPWGGHRIVRVRKVVDQPQAATTDVGWARA